MERHQRIQLKTTSRSIDQPFKVSPFQTRGFGVQPKAASTPASKAELWENYQRSTQMTQKGSHPSIQAKLTIGQPGDKYEQEADSVADRVMAMSEPAQVQREELGEEEEELQMKPLAGMISPLVQREELPEEEEELQMKPEDHVVQREELPEEEEELQMKSLDNSIQREELPEEEEELQMKEASTPSSQLPTDSLEDRLSSSKGGGSPLSDDVRSFMEPRFGADFSGVRVHTGSDAVQMNQDVNAQAFAHGSDVYFGAGKAPGKDALTAHELTHVVQQTGGMQLNRNSLFLQRECSICEENERIQHSSVDKQQINSKEIHTIDKGQIAVQRDSASTLSPAIQALMIQYAPEIKRLKALYDKVVRYGNWCGPGDLGKPPINNIDRCCQTHDNDYKAVGVSSGSDGIGMFSFEGITRTMIADLKLVVSTQATFTDPHWYGARATAYREGVLVIFGGRAAIAEHLMSVGYVPYIGLEKLL